MAVFFSTSFFSAFLLFLVQPMVGKNLLPVVGGSSSAWNSCMLFFQLLLLAGYLWTHFSVKIFGAKKQAGAQILIFIVSLWFLGRILLVDHEPPENPSFWLIVQLFKTVGLPFFAISAMSPLLQLWYSNIAAADKRDPYFLYAASNAGSLASLLAYPFLIEPFIPLSMQAKLWGYGFILLLVLIIACRLISDWRGPGESEETEKTSGAEPSCSISASRIFVWFMAAFIPSALLLAVTQFISTDIAPMPFLWIFPLSVYLITFIIAFSSWRPDEKVCAVLAALGVAIFPAGYFILKMNLITGIPLHLFCLLAIALYCHASLGAGRPGVSSLTLFYAVISAGGAAGGFFVTFLAPNLFTTFFEYPLLILGFVGMAGSLWPSTVDATALKPMDKVRAIVFSLFTALYVAGFIAPSSLLTINIFARQVLYNLGFDPSSVTVIGIVEFMGYYQDLFSGLLIIFFSALPVWYFRSFKNKLLLSYSVGLCLFLFLWQIGTSPVTLLRARNFFGCKKVDIISGLQIKTLTHGTTQHGMQCYSEGQNVVPLTYYHPRGPLGSIFSCPWMIEKTVRVACIGLGVGSMAAYARPGDEFIFYEIDPQVIQIAKNSKLFTFLSDKEPMCRLMSGDGRKSISGAPSGYFDLIFVDAFSSDSVPAHLITQEAVKEYLARLSADGILVFHVSNRYIELAKVLSAIARDNGLHGLTVFDVGFDASDPVNFQRIPSEYVVLARTEKVMKELEASERQSWKPLDLSHDFKAWTDDYSSLFPLLRSRPVFPQQAARPELLQ